MHSAEWSEVGRVRALLQAVHRSVVMGSFEETSNAMMVTEAPEMDVIEAVNVKRDGHVKASLRAVSTSVETGSLWD